VVNFSFSDTAMEYIRKQNQINAENGTEKQAVVLFYHSSDS
jgi:hypothetical protein